jgi:hypothetical protein
MNSINVSLSLYLAEMYTVFHVVAFSRHCEEGARLPQRNSGVSRRSVVWRHGDTISYYDGVASSPKNRLLATPAVSALGAIPLCGTFVIFELLGNSWQIRQ